MNMLGASVLISGGNNTYNQLSLLVRNDKSPRFTSLME